MRKSLLSLLGAASVFAIVSSASAADLPTRAEPPPPIPFVPVFTWTGFYVGLNAGYGWGDDNNGDIFVPAGTFPAPFAGVSGTLSSDTGDNEGFVGGGQIGYNWQFGSFVVGAEADIQWADFGDGGRVAVVPAGFPATFVPTDRGIGGIDWFGTVRARLGFAFDRALIYATGGFAYASGGDNNGTCFVGTFVTACGNNDDTKWGWTLGAGVEYAVTNNFIVGLEGLWVSLDEDNLNTGGFIGTFTNAAGTVVPVFVPGLEDKRDNEFGLIRARVSYKF
jgi:outer membrane immunogenic protein